MVHRYELEEKVYVKGRKGYDPNEPNVNKRGTIEAWWYDKHGEIEYRVRYGDLRAEYVKEKDI
jgi:hypothetical protein